MCEPKMPRSLSKVVALILIAFLGFIEGEFVLNSIECLFNLFFGGSVKLSNGKLAICRDVDDCPIADVYNGADCSCQGQVCCIDSGKAKSSKYLCSFLLLLQSTLQC